MTTGLVLRTGLGLDVAGADAGDAGPPGSGGFILQDDSGFLLLEDGSFLLLE